MAIFDKNQMLTMPFMEFAAVVENTFNGLAEDSKEEDEALSLIFFRKRRRLAIHEGIPVAPPATIQEREDVSREVLAAIARDQERWPQLKERIAARQEKERQASAIMDWRGMPAGKAKYQAYLASRDWAVLKEQVKARSGGTCEWCHYANADQVHHQTYERLYVERIEDLLHVCEPCHKFFSGK